MNTTKEIEGRWWIFGPDKPPHYGKLIFDTSKALRLEVSVAASIAADEMFKDFGRQPEALQTIGGRDEHDKPVTLFACVPSNSNISGGLKKYSFSSLLAIIGDTPESWNKACYRKVRFHLTLMDKWLGRNPFLVDVDNGLRVKVAPGDSVEAILTDGTKVSINYDFRTDGEWDSFRLTGHYTLYLEFTQLTAAKDIAQKYIEPWRRLLTLFAGTEVFAEAIFFGVTVQGQSGEWAELLRRDEGIARADRDRHATNMTLPYKEIAADFPDVLKRWFDYHSKLDSALNLYFATIFNRKLYENHQFLLLAQALEVYHNSNPAYSPSVQPRDEFRKRLRKFACCVPKSERAWLIEKLQHANQKTLAQRLDDILDQHSAETQKFIPDRSKFANQVRHTRNYYTHFDEKLREKGKVAQGDDLGWLIQQMRTLLTVCFLKDLGISGTPLSRVVRVIQQTRLISLSQESKLPAIGQSGGPVTPATSAQTDSGKKNSIG